MPQSLPKAGSFNVPQALSQALALHGQGRLAEAERLLDQAQALDPTYPPVMKARLQLARRRKDAGKASSLGERLKTLSAEPAYGSY